MTSHTREFPEKSAGPKHLLAKMNGARQGRHFAVKFGFATECLYSNPPTMAKNIRSLSIDPEEFVKRPASDLTPLAFDFRKQIVTGAPLPILKTHDGTKVSFLGLGGGNSLPIRNMDAEQVWFVHKGFGTCYTDLGTLDYAPGDFIYIPCGMISYFESSSLSFDDTKLIGIQSRQELRLPARHGCINSDVPFSQTRMKIPEPYQKNGPDIREINVLSEGMWSEIEYAMTPFLCVAWQGTKYPFVISTKDLNFAYTTSIHPDPTNFTLFLTPDRSVMISVLGPRLFHSAPYYHFADVNEFLFYAKKYGARKGSANGVGEAGTATLHPRGSWHGPQKPPAQRRGGGLPFVDELGLMIETRSGLRLCHMGGQLLVPDYEHSWSEK